MKTHHFCFLISLLALAGCSQHEEAPPKPVVAVKVAPAEVADVKITVSGPAFLFGREQANLSARVTAPIKRLLVRKGDRVSAGQVLAELDNRDLLAQRDEAAAAVTDAEANLQRVAAGTLPADIERARGQLAAAEAALRQAEKFYERRRQLYQQGAIPQRDLVLTETELAQAKANHQVAQKSLDLLLNQSRDREILMAKSKVEQARARLALVKAQLEFTEVRSPTAGSVTEQFIFPGDMAKPDSPIFTVVDLSVAVARAQIPETEAGAVRSGAACVFSPADNPGRAFHGRVTVVNHAVDPAKRTVESWCEIPNGNHALRAGAFGQVQIVTGTAPKSVVVPLPAVQFVEGTNKGVVMVAGDKDMAVKKEVETGAVFEGKVQIKSGVSAGERVVVQGGYGLPEGTQLKIQEEQKQ